METQKKHNITSPIKVDDVIFAGKLTSIGNDLFLNERGELFVVEKNLNNPLERTLKQLSRASAYLR